MKYINLKNKLKELANRIRELKSHRKQDNRGDWSIWDIEYNIWRDKREYRHKHIAYCLLRGRMYDEIERPGADNPANMALVNKYMEQYNVKEENVCTGS